MKIGTQHLLSRLAEIELELQELDVQDQLACDAEAIDCIERERIRLIIEREVLK